MKKPRDVSDLASRLASAATTPLVSPAAVMQAEPAPAQAMAAEASQARPAKAARGRRPAKTPSRSLFLRISAELYEAYDREAVRRTKETGRGVTVQQVILDRLAEARA